MKGWYVGLFIGFKVLWNVHASGMQPKPLSMYRFMGLANKIGLKPPMLKSGEFEVRIWNQKSFQYGEAQILYVLTSHRDRFGLVKYVFKSGKKRLKSSKKLKPDKPVTDSLWYQLAQQDILALPDESAIESQLRPYHDTSTWVTVEKDSSISIRGHKREKSVWILDGESYYFEVFGQDSYRTYTYSNPKSYLHAKPQITQLQKVVCILNSIESRFLPSSK
ncbi:hypothetical protein WBJ53_00140 [Spirosoma sp. SC4-14]|uniref:hypothetical protein n=1 Tax=Spirosoma sp. SC4-14 TaxID=3128900 RepID=UPI0030D08285